MAVMVLRALQASRLEANVFHCSATINACAKEGHWATALDLLRSMVENKIEAHTVTYSAVISACEKGAQWRIALHVLSLMVDAECEIDIITYDSAMSACEKAGQWSASLELFRSLQDSAIEADTIVYNTAITACGKGQHWAKALACLGMMGESRVKADRITYNAVISACEKGGHWTMALDLLQAMTDFQVERDTITCNSAISACEKGAEWEMALQLLSLMPEVGVERDTITFASAISACEKGKKWSMALDILKTMSEVRVETNAIAFSAAIHACEVCDRWALTLDLLSDMLHANVEDCTVSRLQHVRTYVHSFLAGGPEDCLKHVVLVMLLQEMVRDSTPLHYVDTHAGCGVYDLASPEARQFCNFEDGVMRVSRACHDGNSPRPIAEYIAALQSLNKGMSGNTSMRYYLGSAGLAQAWLRPQDRATLFEHSAPAAAALRRSVSLLDQSHVRVLQQDSYEWLTRAPSGFFSGRGLVLMDPPYDSVNSYFTWNLFMLRHLSQQWPHSCIALWYPYFNAEQTACLHRRAEDLQLGDVLVAELLLQRPLERQLPGSGLLLVRPPQRLHDELKEVLPALGRMLSPSSEAGVRTHLFWLGASEGEWGMGQKGQRGRAGFCQSNPATSE